MSSNRTLYGTISATAPYGDTITQLDVKFAPTQSSTPSLMPETESVYLRRATEGTGELMKLVGGSVAWNQLFKAAGASTINGIAYSRSEDLSTQTMNGTASANSYRSLPDIPSTVVNHIYYVSQEYAIPGVQIYNDSAGVATQGDKETIGKATAVKGWYIRVASGTTLDNVSIRPLITDLTQMLNPTIADYVYSLEQATAGSGIAWLKKYDLIDDQYHAYSAPTLQSVEATSHIAKDGNGNVISTTTFGSVTLRGILMKDADGNLYYDGDTYEWDGTVTRYFGERAYQAGDESLTGAITDGTNTVYKLDTPTTESADPYTAVQTVEDGGTEEFVTTNGVPVGVVGRFANAVPMEGVDSFTVTANDGTVHTYPVTLSEEVYSGVVDMLTGEAVSEAASIAEYNGETISTPWLSSLDVYSAGATPTNGAQVVYPITPEEVTATITGDPTELGEVTSVTSTKGTVKWGNMMPLGLKAEITIDSPF